LFGFHDHWVGVYSSSSFTAGGKRNAMILRYGYGCVASMVIALVIDVTLLTVVSVMGLFPPNNFYFPGRCYWIRFLLFIIS